MQAVTDITVVPGVRGRRHILLDERGVGLRATWHPGHGFINVSLWRDDRCVETFHLTPEAASDLVAFVIRALASSVPEPTHQPPRAVPDATSGDHRHSDRETALTAGRQWLADRLESAARRLRR